ncbi:Geraniol 8-hydroxylase [Acorus calamus]|uniref:Geraniol 8-hydroxylase n=1 Tax=Acorus calamus TaxID=4465 RepID=A0AAV9FGP6_ACOCL|nr:Geraniol 8-hydroxylase [Acorus calamus]
MVEAGSPNLSDYFPILRRMDLQGRRRRLRANFQKLYVYFDKMIDGRLRHASANATRSDFLDVLLQSLQRSEIDRATIKSLLTNGNDEIQGKEMVNVLLALSGARRTFPTTWDKEAKDESSSQAGQRQASKVGFRLFVGEKGELAEGGFPPDINESQDVVEFDYA